MKFREIKTFLGSIRSDLISEIRKADPEKTSLRKAEDKWKMTEILDHLARAEKNINLVLDRMLRKFREQSGAGSTDIESVKIRDTLINLEYNSVITVAAAEGTEPDSGIDLGTALENLELVRRETLDKLEYAGKHDMSNAEWRHRYMGRMNFYEWIYFIAKHEQIHLQQLKMLIDTL